MAWKDTRYGRECFVGGRYRIKVDRPTKRRAAWLWLACDSFGTTVRWAEAPSEAEAVASAVAAVREDQARVAQALDALEAAS